MKFQLPDLLIDEKKAFRIHLIYSVIEGLIAGLLVMNEFIFLKSLKGSNTLVTILFQLSTVLLIFSVFINELIRRIKDKKKMLLITALVTRLPLVLFFFFPSAINTLQSEGIHFLYLLIFFFFFLANPVILPIVNALLKSNYRHENFGTLFAISSSVKQICLLVGTFVFGLLLDYNNYIFRYVFPVMGVLGFLSIVYLYSVKYEYAPIAIQNKSLVSIINNSMRNMWHILVHNKAYRYYQIAFMSYGFAFMLTVTIISIFLVKELTMSFTDIAFYKNYFNIISIVLLPAFGRLLGKTDPRKFGIFSFLTLLLHLVFLIVADKYQAATSILGIKINLYLIISYTFMGLFAATMGLLWHIGSAYFCGENDTAEYHSIHLTLTGMRASFAPLIGVGLYELIGFTAVFWLGIFFLLVGMGVFLYSLRKNSLNNGRHIVR